MHRYIIGSWYRKDELAKPSCIFHTSGSIGEMFSGYLMAAVHHLGRQGGLKGWVISNYCSQIDQWAYKFDQMAMIIHC